MSPARGGIRQPGRSTHALVGQVDLIATFAELANAHLPDNSAEDSQSFADILMNPEGIHDRLPLINHAMDGRFAVTRGDWKLIMPHNEDIRELYNLASDPGEETNLIDSHPEIAERLEKDITDIVLNGRTTPGKSQNNDTGHWKDLTWIKESDYLQK